MTFPRGFAIRLCLIAIAAFALVPAGAAGATVTLEQVGGEFDQPTFIASEPGNANRLLIAERSGLIKEFDGSATSVFLDARPQVQYVAGNSCCYEKGLFSIAFAPDYATSRSFFIVYTAGVDDEDALHGDIVLDEFKTDGAGVALPASRREVLRIPQPNNHHYGGQLAFGPEGLLYLSVGDGDTSESPQDLNSLHGKILRIDPHESGASPYTVPADNPFVGQAGKRAEIWSYGFRNAWRFSFDPANGALAIGDVGGAEWEEVNYVLPSGGKPAGWGLNFGWPCREGAQPSTFPTTLADGCPLESDFTDPIFQYGHETIDGSPDEGCAVIGGYVAHDPSLGDVNGRYVYADLCASQLRSFSPSATPPVTDRFEVDVPTPSPGDPGTPETFGQDSCGRIYVGTALSRVYRMVGPSPTVCPKPAAPTLSSTVPASPANDNAPRIKGTAEAGTTIALYSSANCKGMPIGRGPSSELATGIAVSVPDDSTTAIRATATSSIETSTCSAPIAYTEDSTAPPPGSGNSPPVVIERVATKATLKVIRPAKNPNSKTVLQASVTPCAGRKGSPIELKRGAKVILRRRLDAKCHATFKVRAPQGAKLRAFVPEFSPYAEGTSKPATIPPSRSEGDG